MIQMNGEKLDYCQQQSLVDFLTAEHFATSKIAVELNGQIIPKSQYETTMLKDGDVLEVVTFVGGG